MNRAEKMIRLLESETNKAVAEGYSALRVTGEMTWALHGLSGSEKLMEYESKLNYVFPKINSLEGSAGASVFVRSGRSCGGEK